MVPLAVPRGRMINDFDPVPRCPCCGTPQPPERGTYRSMVEIATEVAQSYKLRVSDLKGKEVGKTYSWPRQEAMYAIRKETGYSLTKIGRFFNRDHTTVIHSLRTHGGRMERNKRLAA